MIGKMMSYGSSYIKGVQASGRHIRAGYASGGFGGGVSNSFNMLKTGVQGANTRIRAGNYNAAAAYAGVATVPAGLAWTAMGAVNAFRSGDNIGLF